MGEREPQSDVRTGAEMPPLDPGTTAWLLAVPCMLLAAMSAYALGPPLGHVLFPPRDLSAFWSPSIVLAESTELARYLILLSGPLLLTIALIASMRRRPTLRAGTAAIGGGLVQSLFAALLAACMISQYHLAYGAPQFHQFFPRARFFVPRTLAVAAVLMVSGAVVAR